MHADDKNHVCSSLSQASPNIKIIHTNMNNSVDFLIIFTNYHVHWDFVNFMGSLERHQPTIVAAEQKGEVEKLHGLWW
jgi:hypothetical protein